MSTLAEYSMVNRTYADRINMVANESFTKREVAYFRENISKVATGDELMEDYRLYRFAMKAFGLESEIYAKGLMRKVFDEGVADKKSTANLMSDEAYRDIATAFGFAETGNLNMLFEHNVDDIVDKYLKLELEERVGESNQGVRLALYFERKIGDVEDWYSVIGDPALYEVARTMLGLPQEFVQTDVDKQVAYFEKRLPIEDLKDPAKLDKWMQRFTAMWDVAQTPATGIDLAANGIAPIQPLGSTAEIIGIDPALLADLAQYKLR
ncbi:DUF1217 domain-containing protein [Tepidicaulis sp. LMO-SS28]|uniref:DUF1217 domain-containing protein n=1 Tax=Tepidicaulis sp. LMO-SS28 TaxID=3447455 RepID=UPI003EDF7E5F